MSYDAFISYNQAADGHLAPKLQSGLRRLGNPWYRRRSLRIFRDQTSLSASPSLWASIEKALDVSRYFVLLAAPEAAASEWVCKELSHWLRKHPPETILIVLTDGAIAWDAQAGDFDWTRTNALPEELRGIFKDEPLHVDLRWARGESQLTLEHPDFLNAVADLAATIQGRDKDELVGEDIRQHKRAKLTAWAAGSVVVVLAVAAVVAAYQASLERDQKERQRQVAQSGRLAAESRFALEERRYDLGLLLGIEAIRANTTGPTPHARMALFRALYSYPELTTYVRTKSPAADVAFSPDSRHLAILQDNGNVALWNTDSEKLARTFPRPDSLSEWRTFSVGFVSFSDSGKTLAMAGPWGIVLWNVDSGQLQTQIDALKSDLGKAPPFNKIAISDDHSVAATEDGKSVVLRDLVTGEATGPVFKHDTAISALTFADDDYLLIGDHKGRISVIDLATHTPTGRQLETQSAYIEHLLFHRASLHNAYLITVSPITESYSGFGGSTRTRKKGSEIRLWDWESRKPIGNEIRLPMTTIDDLAVLGSLLVTRSALGKVQFWNLSDGLPLPPPLEVMQQAASRLTLAPRTGVNPGAMEVIRSIRGRFGVWSGRTLELLRVATIGNDGAVLLFDMAGKAPVSDLLPAESFMGTAVGLSTHGSVAITESWGKILFHDLFRGEQVAEIATESTGLGSHIFEHAISADGLTMAAISGGAVSIYHARSGRKLLETTAEDILGLALSADGGLLATGTRDGVVSIWDSLNGNRVAALPDPLEKERASALAFSPDGRLLAIGSSVTSAEGVKLWEMMEKRYVSPIPAIRVGDLPQLRAGFGQNQLKELRFSPDGHRLAGRFLDGTLMLWDVASRRLVSPPVRPGSANFQYRGGMNFSPDGALLVVISDDHEKSLVTILDVETGRMLGKPLWEEDGAMIGVAFSSDGERIVALDSEGRALVWKIGEAWEQIACEIANRNLTCDEWNRYFTEELYRKTCPHLWAPDEC